MYEYRSKLYSAYHQTQAGRSQEQQGTSLLKQQMYYLKKEFSHFLPSEKRAVILDIGCGFGTLVAVLHELGYANSSGIDLSADQIETGTNLGIKNLMVADIGNYLQNKSNEFDCICGLDILEHFSKDELIPLLDLLHQSLKPGGYLLLRTPNGDAPLSNLFALGDFTHECIFNKSSAIQLMKSCAYEARVYPSYMEAQGFLKELLRRFLWNCLLFRIKITLFASGRTWHQSVFTPNLIIRAQKSTGE